MNVLVFGRDGQVARALAAARPGDIRRVGRDEADLSDPDACAAVIAEHRPAAVINAAAWTDVNGAETREAAAHVVNAAAPGAMARSCAALSIPFLHISSDYVFDGSGAGPWCETDPVAPQNAYGRTKLAGERAVAEAGGDWVVLRTSWVFAPIGTNFVRTMLNQIGKRDEVQVVTDEIGGPTPAGAIADALLRVTDAIRDGASGRGIYHFAGHPAASWETFARESFDRAGVAMRVRGITSRDYAATRPAPWARRPLNSRLDCGRIFRDFGIEQPDWRPALDTVIEQWRKEQDKQNA